MEIKIGYLYCQFLYPKPNTYNLVYGAWQCSTVGLVVFVFVTILNIQFQGLFIKLDSIFIQCLKKIYEQTSFLDQIFADLLGTD